MTKAQSEKRKVKSESAKRKRVLTPLVCRRDLRATTDKRIHDAVVSHTVRHLSAQVNRSQGLGCSSTRGIRDPPQSVGRYLGHHAAVSNIYG